ncbi:MULTISPECIES: flagellar filament capping protein FliD [unclassified Clostridium]|uniref:flagellar filament capping protein FliD n=1 Tax=unclassified Clostridium TaxID=2614128 RepID=UPI0032168E61
MRITGLATGLDMDQLVKETMQPYRIRIQQQQQKKEITEIKQQLYRDVIKESRELYNKYFDVAKTDSLLLSKNWSTAKFTSSNENVLTVTSGSDAKPGNYTVTGNIATAAKATVTSDMIIDDKVLINGKEFTLKGDTAKARAENLNKELKAAGMNVAVRYSDFAGTEAGNKSGFIFESTVLGKDSTFTIGGTTSTVTTIEGRDADITIKDGKGGEYKHTGTSNTVTLDGITFKFTGEIPKDSTIDVNGKSDVTEVKEKVVNFINDYNKLMEKLNTLTSEKRNRNFMPLTDEQKKEMSESEIKLWEERVKKGQLYKDSDVSRIANSMKSDMKGLVEGVDGYLEKLGIKPVSDYQGTKNGTYTIDETKLTEALENNSEEVMKLFISSPTSVEGMTDQEKNSKMGIAQRLKTTLYNETVTVVSSLIKKAGIEGSATVANNELTKSIEKYERKMVDMEKDFSRREQQLYSKWATIESMMNKLNSQQSYLMSQLGMA